MNTTVTFGELPLGAEFEFAGRHYQKRALSLTEDERRWGYVLQEVTVVTPIGLRPEDLVKPWRSGADKYWADYLTPAPGQR